MTMTTEVPTTVRSTDDAPATWFLNGLMTTLATHEETRGAYCLMEHRLTAAANPPVHLQEVEDEAFFVLEGEIEFEVDGETAVARPGTFAFVPRGAVHTFRVVSDEARMLVIASGDAPSGGLHSFFEVAGEPAGRRELPEPSAPDPTVLVPLAAERGISILPPPA
jgi:quercetin dioxygenase-like cupin family protein